MRKTHKLTLIVILLAGLLLARRAAWAGGGGGGPCSGFGSGPNLALRDNCFDYPAHFAEAGSLLTVTNEGQLDHSFTAVEGTFDTGLLKPGETASIRLGEAGIVQVYCTLHGTASGQGMAGIVIVGEPAPVAIGGVAAPPVQSALDQQTAQITSEIEARAAADAELRTDLVSIQRQLDAMQLPRAAAPALLGLLGALLGGGALAAVYARRRDVAYGSTRLPAKPDLESPGTQ